MTIEIKQLLIKSNIVQRACQEELELSEGRDVLKVEVLAECRRLIVDILQEKEER
ncbi:DUF5908 family protein [Nitrosomonas supralitoralis]|uniref:DUF5908 family protein n=1 Tax=Nitrosomonas supralitoralis TaxID=2116706 RepID=UPI0015599DAB|nr:DUF5908 family protein [Nitrosomonas supralitoralis]